MKLGQRFLMGALAVCAVALFAACGDEENARSTKVFEAPPWTGQETMTYRLSFRGEDPGTCTLETKPEFEAGHTRLVRLCERGGYRDDGMAVVDSKTLQPVRSQRTLVDPEKNRRTVHSIEYGPEIITFATDVNGEVSDTTRELPKPDSENPNPGWYDDESLFWLVRGIPLRAGYDEQYTHVINAGAPRVSKGVEVIVDPVETVKVPAGTYSAWKVRIRQDKRSYLIWVEEAAPHRMVRAQIEDATYELTEAR